MTNAESDAAYMALAQWGDITVAAGAALLTPLNGEQRRFVLDLARREERACRIECRILKELV